MELENMIIEVQQMRENKAQQAAAMQAQIQQMMNKMQNLMVEDPNPKIGVKLRKLPLFGKQVPDTDIDFKYPSD